jgi:membrane peptidoglycan carboxypeptidase
MRIDYPRSQRTGVRRFWPSWRQWLGLAGIGAAATFIGAAAVYASVDIPNPNDLATAQATVLTWDDGTTTLATIAEANRRSVPLEDVPQGMQDAMLSAEDRTFYENSGFSISGIARAAWTNVRSDSTVGGSTITQQYAKNAYLTQEKTFTRKAKELVLSVKLSQVRSKERILEDYLNTIYFGRGAYGVEAASQAYFKKNAKRLTTEEAAVLAAIVRSPGGYAPESNLDRLEGRWNYVLDGMVAMGNLGLTERLAMEFPEPVKRSTTNRLGGDRGYLVDMVKRELVSLGYTEDEIARGGFRVVTTFNREAQAHAREAVEDMGPTSGSEGLRIGIAAVRPDDGAVVAIYGGDDYVENQFNNATQGIQQAGSTFKPFALAAGLEEGFSLTSRFEGNNDSTFEFPGFEPYEVPNFDNVSYGRSVSLLRATERSINTAYVDLALQVTPRKVVEAAVRAGIPEDAAGLNAGPTTVLGTASPHTIDLASAYATFANEGVRNDPFVVQRVIGSNGTERYAAPSRPERAFAADVANEVTYALARVVTNGSGFEADDLGRPAAGKTGTTNENKSAWFVGYTPEIAVAVSMSKSDSSGNPITLAGTGGLDRVTGGSFPARMWTEFVSLYLEDEPEQDFPGRAGEVFGSRNGTGGSGGARPTTSAPRPTVTAPPAATTTPTAPPSTPKPTLTIPPTSAPPVTEPPGGGGPGGGGGGPGGGGGGGGGNP